MLSRGLLRINLLSLACIALQASEVKPRSEVDESHPPSLKRWAGITVTNGKLYMYGGRGSSYFQDLMKVYDDFYEFDIKSRTWKDLSRPLGGVPPTPRFGVELVEAGGKLYVYSGLGDEILGNDLFEYDIAKQTWTDLSTPASGHAPRHRDTLEFFEYKRKLYVFGGIAGSRGDHIFLHSYDIASKTWTDLSHTWGGTATFLRYKMGLANYEGKVYVFGGMETGGGTKAKTNYNDLREFDLEKGTWTDLSVPTSGSVPFVRNGVGMTAHQGSLFIFGGSGRSTPEGKGGKHDDMWQYSLKDKSWKDISTPAAGSPPSKRVSMELVAYNDFSVSYELFNDLHEYDISARTWTDLSTPTADDSEEL